MADSAGGLITEAVTLDILTQYGCGKRGKETTGGQVFIFSKS